MRGGCFNKVQLNRLSGDFVNNDALGGPVQSGKAGSERIHQQHFAWLGLVLVYLRHQPGKVFGLAMRVERGLVGPLLNENEVPGVVLIDKQVVGDAQRFLAGFFHQFGVPGTYRVEVFGLDEIFSDDLQHG